MLRLVTGTRFCILRAQGDRYEKLREITHIKLLVHPPILLIAPMLCLFEMLVPLI